MGAGMPPAEPSAGGPDSPFNIEQMLKTNMQGAAPAQPPAPARRPLPPWGDSQGTPRTDYSTSEFETNAGQAPMGDEGATAMGDAGGQMSPMVMLRLLRSLGRV